MRNIVWFFSSFVLVILILFIYNAFYLPIVESKKSNGFEKVVVDNTPADKSEDKQKVIDEEVTIEEKKKMSTVAENSTVEPNVLNNKEDIDSSPVEAEKDEEDIYKQEYLDGINKEKELAEEVSIRGNIKNTDKTPSAKQCLNNGGEVLHDGDCLARWKEAQQICKAMDRKLPTLAQVNKVVKDCKGVIDSGDTTHRENGDNEYYQACYKNQGFDSYEFWTLSSSSSKNYTFVIRFDTADVYMRHELAYAWVRCVEK